MPIVIAALLSLMIFIKKCNGSVPYADKNFLINALFEFAPFIISVLVIYHLKLIYPKLDHNNFTLKMLISSVILFDYIGIFDLLISQGCILIRTQFKVNRTGKILNKVARTWPASIIAPCFATFLYWAILYL